MNDRELLELAAKAAGLKVLRYSDGYGLAIEGMGTWWNPLADDGDALRLAAATGICIIISNGFALAKKFYADRHSLEFRHEHMKPGESSPVRRAIVRAAAMIGESM